ncbi:hypothetical protein V8B97DRAFT_2009523 [Scleroderma yunnanense]
MSIDIQPGRYVIQPIGVSNRAIGMTPLLHPNRNQVLKQGKPVEVVPTNFPEYTRVWEVQQDGTLALSFMGSQLAAVEEDDLVWVGSPAERWTIRTHYRPYGQTIQNADGLAWFLPNTDEYTQPELRELPIGGTPPLEFLFVFNGPLN